MTEVKLPSGDFHCTSLMRSQQWFRWWLGAIRQQAMTWANVDHVLCHHKASLGHNEFLELTCSNGWWSWIQCELQWRPLHLMHWVTRWMWGGPYPGKLRDLQQHGTVISYYNTVIHALTHCALGDVTITSNVHMGQVTKLRLSCYLVLLSIDSKTR